LEVTVPAGIDTDSLGSFTGEVPRRLSMRETARAKARIGMTLARVDIGIASEGSFGPHPVIPFLPGARELLLFLDETRGLEIVEEVYSESTNFATIDLTPQTDLDAFLAQIGFPGHAVIVRAGTRLIKGLSQRDSFDGAIEQAKAHGPVRIETDMRAHLNPTRMAEIGRLAEKLAQRLATCCPACGAPGFGKVSCDIGLPCEACGAKTQLIRAAVSGCALCSYKVTKPRPDGRTFATPAECPECNP
jgi:hypothetical protein